MSYPYLLAGMSFRNLFRQLRRHKTCWQPRSVFRVLFLLQSSLWSSLFALIERKRFKKKLELTEVPNDPIFIVGHWRSGSTYLHQLMSRDPGLKAPTLFEVALPEAFLSSGHYYRPVLRTLVPHQRPMDNVKMGVDEPQEDEYAFYRMSNFSPLERLIFPDEKGYYLTGIPTFLPDQDDRDKWEEAVRSFYRKLTFQSGKRIISKNPFNSLRIMKLAQMFPEARFIHIFRNPLDVVPSTIHMFTIVQRQNCLNNDGSIPTVKEVTDFYLEFIRELKGQFSSLPEDRVHEVRFEDLEKNPKSVLQSIYAKFNLPVDPTFFALLDDSQPYVKNRYLLNKEDKEYILTVLGELMKDNGYL
jgi:omega-hydroxy-beta-dihydromenaquinone-9 sulfotransferase